MVTKNFILVIAMLLLVVRANATWQNVAQEWAPYRLDDNQKKWFKDVRAPNGVPCCDISDGHPTQVEHCSSGRPNRPLKSGERNLCDGYENETYLIPHPIFLQEPRSWIPIPKEAVIKGVVNPIGVATVWWVQRGSYTVYIRCFIPESET